MRSALRSGGKKQDLKSWFIAIGALLIALTASAISAPSSLSSLSPEAENRVLALDERENSALTCQLSAFTTADRESPKTQTNKLKFEGRALLTCRHSGGFTSEIPLLVELEADTAGIKPDRSEIALSGNSSPFIIPRDVGQIQDLYRSHSLSSNFKKSEPKIILRGTRHDILIELGLSSHTTPIENLKVHSLRFKFDERAPTLKAEL